MFECSFFSTNLVLGEQISVLVRSSFGFFSISSLFTYLFLLHLSLLNFVSLDFFTALRKARTVILTEQTEDNPADGQSSLKFAIEVIPCTPVPSYCMVSIFELTFVEMSLTCINLIMQCAATLPN